MSRPANARQVKMTNETLETFNKLAKMHSLSQAEMMERTVGFLVRLRDKDNKIDEAAQAFALGIVPTYSMKLAKDAFLAAIERLAK
jgi:preprotein translocase subunit SecA